MFPTEAAFRYLLSVLKIYSACHVYHRFSVLAVNIKTQPEPHEPYDTSYCTDIWLCSDITASTENL